MDERERISSNIIADRRTYLMLWIALNIAVIFCTLVLRDISWKTYFAEAIYIVSLAISIYCLQRTTKSNILTEPKYSIVYYSSGIAISVSTLYLLVLISVFPAIGAWLIGVLMLALVAYLGRLIYRFATLPRIE